MKTTNVNQPGERTHGVTRGHVGRSRAGTPGLTLRDATTTADAVNDLTITGGTLTDNDDGTAILEITAPANIPAGTYLTASGGGAYVIETIGSSGSAVEISCSAANIFDITLTANCTITISNPPAAGVGGIITVILRQGGTGSYTVTWPGSVAWQDTDGTTGGSAPTLWTAVGAQDVIELATEDGGTTWGGSTIGGDHGQLTGLGDDDHTQYTKKATLTTTGDLYYASSASTPARLGIGTSGQVLGVAAGLPAWTTPAAGETHVHVAYETHTSDGSTTTFTLDHIYEPGSVMAWNRTTGHVLGITEVLPDQATVSAAGTAADLIDFHYAASVI